MVKTLNTSNNSLIMPSKDTRIAHFLQAEPHLLYSKKVLPAIARKLNVSVEYLQKRICALRKPRHTPDLSELIRSAKGGCHHG